MTDTLRSIVRSWADPGAGTEAELLAWVAEQNAAASVDIRKITLDECDPWSYDPAEGCIRNRDHSFFTIAGLRGEGFEQPIILQQEICLLATKGHPARKSAGIHQFIISPVEQHSKKPDETRDKITALMGDLPRIELFARQKTPGWDAWGNEVENNITL